MSMSGRGISPAPSTSIIDILDRVLDKGLVVAGDISISLANVELLTIRIRLLVCSIDKAEQIGLNWWRYDRNLVAPGEKAGAVSAGDSPATDVRRLEQRIADLERTLKQATPKR
ncbi:MAG TPA: gas vesicle protein [Candidatus Limnocylindria bacterium]